MLKEQFIEIAKCAFPDKLKELIDFDNCEMMCLNNVYRLYDKDTEYTLALPRTEHLCIHIEDKFIQISCGNKAFNHYAAIKKMEELHLI